MAETTVFDFDKALRSLAWLQQQVEANNARLQAERDALYAMHVQVLDEQIAANKAYVQEIETQIKEQARKAALEDGDRQPHALIEIKRKPQEYTYNDQEVIEALEREGVEGFIRVKKELDKTPLKAALRKGELPWLPVEPAPTDVTVTIKPLGELLIVGGGE